MQVIERRFPQKRFLLCLDEFERLEQVIADTNSFIPLNFLRNFMQHRKQWILLFCGSHNLSELQPYWTDYLIGTRKLRLTYLNESEARDLIRHPVPDFPDIYEDAAVDAIIQLTKCQPYFVQLVCSALVERLNKLIPNRTRLTIDDVNHTDTAMTAIERADGYFNELWRTTLNQEHRDFLTRFVQNDSLTTSDHPILSQLIQMEILERISEDKYQFQVPLVQKFVEMMIFNHH